MTEPFELLATPLPPCTTLLEASAGTGKTYALAAIYLRLIAEEGLTIGQIAVTTYTIPATEELRTRIRARLVEAVQVFDGAAAETPFVGELAKRHAGDAKIRQRLADALRDFDEACISTIHGFCQRILRERAFETGAAPDAELIPDQSSIVREIAEDFWRQHFSSPGSPAAPLALLHNLAPRHLAALWKTAASQPTATLVPAAASADPALRQIEALFAELRLSWPTWRPAVRRIFVEDPAWAIAGWRHPEVNAAHLAGVEQLAADIFAPQSCYAALAHFRPSWIEEKGGIGKRKQLPSFAFGNWCERFAEASAAFAAATRAEFLTWARPELLQRKAAAGLMSFDDLLTRLHDALHAPGPAATALVNAVRARFRASLVDEFQDTDPIQDAIFRRLFAEDPEHRLFLIGDPKQAIYAFRGADLHTYLAARKRAGRVFLLATNYRSDAALVEAVNTLFLRPAAPFIDEIEYPPTHAVRVPEERDYFVNGEARAPFRFSYWDDEKPIGTGRAGNELPVFTAASIANLLATAKLKGRALRPCDIAVLCWKNEQCQAVQTALGARRIPAVILTGVSVFNSREARELRLILAALCRPNHEASVRTALATSPFGFDAAALMALAEDTAAWEAQLLLFADAHARWRDRGFVQMFRHLLRDIQARHRLLAMPDGERRLTNFLHLAEILHGTAREFGLDPGGLLRWFHATVESPSKTDEYEQRLESDEDAVKVLTVHKSKGLEWPVVFCPFLWTKADLHEEIQTVFHDAHGQPVLDLGSSGQAAAQQVASDERLAENLRQLYVALTRARHECHVVWGLFNQSTVSALMWVLEPPLPRGAPDLRTGPKASASEQLRAHAGGLDSAHLRATITQLAHHVPGQISVEELRFPDPTAPRDPPPVPSASDRTPTARSFTTLIDRTWRVSSFSSLTAGAESDRDRDFDDRPRFEESQLRGIHAFPRSNRSGICIHEIFEELEFTDPAAIRGLVRTKLQAHGLFTEERTGWLAQCVADTLAAPLGSARLNTIPKRRTLRELEFHLPARLLTPAQLVAVAGAGLNFEPRRGILTGYIDLIFEDEGRYHIVDWKSNHLGMNEEAYTVEAIHSAMEHHRYGLQWRLYALALHRFLRKRLRDYSVERHLGSAFYLFIRGLTPGRPDLGIFQATPTAADIAALERTFLP